MFDYRTINRTNFHNLLPDNLHMHILISLSAFVLKHPLTDNDNHVQKKSKYEKEKYKRACFQSTKTTTETASITKPHNWF